MANNASSSVAALFIAVLGLHAVGQECNLEWSTQFPAGTLNGTVCALAVFDDDGAGPHRPALYVGGSFTEAGGVSASRIARWDGLGWSPVGGGVGSTVFALTVYDADGPGPSAPMLVAAGNFNWAGSISVNKIAAWDGSNWWPLGNGTNAVIYALTTFDEDGNGPNPAALFAGGMFTQAGSVAANRIARWNGSSWSALGLGMDNFVNALAVYDDDGSGPHAPNLYAGGGFITADENVVRRVARWDGSTWHRLASSPEEFGVNASVLALTVFDADGAGPGLAALYVGGGFELAGDVYAPYVARWDGLAWSSVGSGVDGPVNALGVFDPDAEGPAPAELHAGGQFAQAGGGEAACIARWSGSAWSPLGAGLNDTARALASFDDDAEGPYLPALYVGGSFSQAGGHPSDRVARWGCPLTSSAPVIASDPESQMACPGASVTFEVAAWGTPPLSYQWRKEGEVLPGATAPQLTIVGAGPDDVGSYDVVVTNEFGSATSTPADLTLGDPPLIVEQPQSVDACPGDAVQFWVVPDGTGPLTMQWYRDGLIIWGATFSVLTINPVQPVHAGAYTVRVTGACGTVESEPAWLTVDQPPAIVEQPQPQTACTGGMVVFRVVADGPPPLSYMWRKDGVEIAGATADTLTLFPVGPGDAGQYDVVVSSACAATTSAAAALTVAGGPTITQPPAAQTVCAGGSAMFSVAATGTPPLSYQWRRDGQALPDATAPVFTIPTVGPEHAGSYDVVVTDACAAVTSASATLTVLPAPTIEAQPVDALVCPGAAVEFTVGASPPPLSYQWRKNGQPIGGATGSSYTITAVSNDDAGLYDVLVSNDCATVTSAVAVLAVQPETVILSPPQPQSACAGDGVTFSVTAAGPLPLTYAWFRNGLPLPGQNGSTLTLAAVTPSDAGQYSVAVTSACATVASAAAALTVNSGPEITGQPQPQAVCEGTAAVFTVVVAGTPPLTYQWMKDGVDIGGANEPTLTIAAVGQGHEGVYAARITNPCGTVTSTPVDLTVNAPPTIDDPPATQTACSGGAVAFHVAAGGPLPLLYQWRKDGVDLTGQNSSSLVIDPVQPDDAGVYSVLISGVCGSIESPPATLTVAAGPVILDPPDDAAVCQGATVVFEVGVTGDEPLHYQWMHDGVSLPGENGSTLVLSGVQPDDAGMYTVVVTAACGTLTSPPASLTVRTGPTIAEPPQSQAGCAGGTVTFSVLAEGVGALGYQWLHDGTAIPGATAAALTLHALGPDDAGEYGVVVTDDCGTSTSAAAALTVAAGLILTVQPQSQAVCAGSPVTFTVVASDPLATFQWRRAGQPLAGATAAMLQLPAVGLLDSGTYDVLVTGGCDSLVSDPAELTVNSGPGVLSGPEDQVACAGRPAALSVSVAGTPPLQYQWRKDGAPIPGAVLDTLVIAAVAPADAARYDVLVTNACGTSIGGPATLTLGAAPSIIAAPQGWSGCAGDPAELRVLATGSPPLEYHWFRDGVELPAAVGPELRIDAVAPQDAGTYRVSVIGPCGAVTSPPAEVRVDSCQSPPEAPGDPQPADGTTGVSSPVTLSWAAAAGAESYAVHFGRSNPPPLAAEVAQPEWSSSKLDGDTAYYWQVVAANAAGSTAGPVWSFRTAGVPVDPNDSEPPDVPPTEPNAPPADPPDENPREPDAPNVPEPSGLACGGGGCGAGAAGALPLTLVGIGGMKVRSTGRRRKSWN